MKPLYVLKIGGSVATHKNRTGFSVRRSQLRKVAQQIGGAMKKADFQLILIHGAGGFGHALAKEYGLKEGTGKNKQKLKGALLSRIANQQLDHAIAEILVAEGLPVVPVHTASVILQNDHKIDFFDIAAVKEALEQGCIPLLYGDMVFDKKLGMTVCSGDSIAPYLAEKLGATKMFFASDIDGVFTQDPYVFRGTQLIEKVLMGDLFKNTKISQSHNVDVTGGLFGKIQKMNSLKGSAVQSIEIFNGFDADNYKKILLNKNFPHTQIFFK